MFEIGTTLRDARVRKDISLQQAEEDTKIRVKYIQAMENEDFDILPAGTYVKGFLRTYAGYLDLDYQLLIDEFNERFGSGDHREHVIQPPKTANTEAPRKRPANYLIVAILAVAIIAVLSYMGWGNKGTEPATLTPTSTESETTAQTQTAPSIIPAPAATVQTQTRPSTLESVSFKAKKPVWVEVVKTSDNKPLIEPHVFETGEIQSLDKTEIGTETRLKLTVGNAELEITINGQPQPPLTVAPADYEITIAGLRKLGG
ncbi:MAG: helix-turn-helix domain-containing protein [Thermoleophilia bacterium]|jgi:cytoskeletal protein RodZ